MNKFSILIFLTFFLSACWSSNELANTNTNSVGENLDLSNKKVEKISTSNSKLVPYGGNANHQIAGPENDSNVKIVKPSKSGEEIRKEGDPAPDNSTFTASFDENGYTGTRTFKDHPKLLKIEKKQSGNKSSLKVYLKNGKVYDASEEKIPNFRVNSPTHILSAIGLGPKVEKKNEINQEKIEQIRKRNR